MTKTGLETRGQRMGRPSAFPSVFQGSLKSGFSFETTGLHRQRGSALEDLVDRRDGERHRTRSPEEKQIETHGSQREPQEEELDPELIR